MVNEDAPASEPWWPGAVGLALAAAGWIYAFGSQPSGAVAWVVGVLAMLVGLGLFVAATRRTLRENAGHRIPWWGTPPVRPRQWDLLAGVGSPFLTVGIVVVAGLVGRGVWPVLVLLAAVVIAAIGVNVVHNRRISTGDPGRLGGRGSFGSD
ncbi:hypothetical protein ACFO6S_12800 [Rhodococcus kronopolitis]|uniref:Uncharacterized protein n=1 Tax=Rhodococcus kronopolitis TaxID=1460226 RepID=A0ABV9FU71_9NOCA